MPELEAVPDLERNLRSVCVEGDGLTPELVRDVLFWLDLGTEPRTVAEWLHSQLEDEPDPPPLSADDGSIPVSLKMRKRKTRGRRVIGRRSAS